MNLNATLFFQAVVFFALVWFVYRFVWPPLIEAIDDRRQKIAEGLAAADKSKNDLALAQSKITHLEAKTMLECEHRVAEAEKQAAAIVGAARDQAETERARILEQAKLDAQIEIERLRGGLRNEVALLAVQGAEQILRREVDAKTHAELLSQLKTQL